MAFFIFKHEHNVHHLLDDIRSDNDLRIGERFSPCIQ